MIAIVQKNTVKKDQSYDGKLLTKCTPYCPGDITKGFGDYVPKEDKCACPEGSGPVINNLTGKKRCEKECKIVNGKNITEWIEKIFIVKSHLHLNKILNIELGNKTMLLKIFTDMYMKLDLG